MAYRYTMTRPGGFEATAIDAWQSSSGAEIWLVVRADPATTAAVLASLPGLILRGSIVQGSGAAGPGRTKVDVATPVGADLAGKGLQPHERSRVRRVHHLPGGVDDQADMGDTTA